MRVRERDDVESRQAQLAAFVRMKGYTRFSELAELAGVSELTIRRDLKELSERGLLDLVPGGATADAAGAGMIRFKREVSLRQREKQDIAREAVGLVRDGDTVLLDGGTTTWYVARALKGRRVQVVTNSLPVADALAHERDIRLVMLGGTLYPDTGLTLGPLCIAQLRTLRPTILFMGVGGIDAEGFSNSNLELVETERAMLEASHRGVIVADSSKFGRGSLARLAGFGEFNPTILTDSGVSPAHRGMAEKAGIGVLVARPGRAGRGGRG